MYDAGAADPGLTRALQECGLTVGSLLDENESFIVLRCRSAADEDLVIKYVRTDSTDAFRRLANEAKVTRDLSAVLPLRVLPYRLHARRYLVTAFDPGRLLGPRDLQDREILRAVLDALVAFQSAPGGAEGLGVVDRERVGFYYLKVMIKNLLHLVPEHIGRRQALRCLGMLIRGLPAITRKRVLCHGDFIPTNLLYHPDDRSVTLTDLEGCMSGNHPLFDLLALLTIEEAPLDEWGWQTWALHHYLERANDGLGENGRDADFARAWRAISIFFLVYRQNETLINEAGTTYFGGTSRWAWLVKRLPALLGSGWSPREGEAPTGATALRQRNLELALLADRRLASLEQPLDRAAG